jgi:hypothetical protein
MEPRREEPKSQDPRPEAKHKRFRLIRLEERIAPQEGGKGTNNCVSARQESGCFSCSPCGTLSIE